MEFPAEKLSLWQIAFRLRNENPITESPPLNVQNEFMRMAEAVLANQLWVRFLPGRQPNLFVVLAKCREGIYDKNQLNLIFVSREDWATYESAELEKANSAPTPKVEAATGATPAPITDTNQNADDWKIQARAIADELFDHDTKMKCRDSLKSYSNRVMGLMQKRDIKGLRGIIDNSATIMRDALQGEKWWANKKK